MKVSSILLSEGYREVVCPLLLNNPPHQAHKLWWLTFTVNLTWFIITLEIQLWGCLWGCFQKGWAKAGGPLWRPQHCLKSWDCSRDRVKKEPCFHLTLLLGSRCHVTSHSLLLPSSLLHPITSSPRWTVSSNWEPKISTLRLKLHLPGILPQQ